MIQHSDRPFVFLSVGLVALAAALTTPLAAQTSGAPVYRWTTPVGRASVGAEDGLASDARFNVPRGLAVDSAGNLYVADTGNDVIRKITPAGNVSTLAGTAGTPGSADGTGTTARFNAPEDVAVDAVGNVYVADTGNDTIRKISIAGSVTTLAGQAGKPGTTDGAAATALFDAPRRLTANAAGDVYVGLRKISAGQVQTRALPAQVADVDGQQIAVTLGDGPAVDSSGNLYFWATAHREGNVLPPDPARILKLDPAGNATVLLKPTVQEERVTGGSIFNDSSGRVFVIIDFLADPLGLAAERGSQLLPDGTLAGPVFDFPLPSTASPHVLGFAVDQANRWYYTRDADSAISRDATIYAGVPAAGATTAADGTGPAARFSAIAGLTVDSMGNTWVIEDRSESFPASGGGSDSHGFRLRKVSPQGSVVTVINADLQPFTVNHPRAINSDASGNVYYLYDHETGAGSVTDRIGPSGSIASLGAGPALSFALASDPMGNLWTFSRADGRIYRRATGGAWLAVAGGASAGVDGSGGAAGFGDLTYLQADRQGNCYALDVIEGNGATPTRVIRKVTPAGVVTTVSPNLLHGTTDNATAGGPTSFTVDSQGFISLTRPGEIVRLDAKGGETVIGGQAAQLGSADGIGDRARFIAPDHLAVDQQDRLYVSDANALRRGEFLGYLPAITTQPQSQTVAAGGSVTFTVTAGDTAGTTYQWYFNGAPLQGATTTTLRLASAAAADAGDYTVVVSSALGSVTSSKATLTVTGGAGGGSTPPAGGTGGGGAPSARFVLVLAALAGARRRLPVCFRRRRCFVVGA